MFGPVETWCQECYGSNKKKNVNSLRDQIKHGKGFHTKKHKKVCKRRDSIERCEKSENDRHENESPVHEYARKLFATINVRNSTVRFQLDSGATSNLLPAKYLEDGNKLTPTRKWLTMYNDTIVKPLCTMEVLNAKNAKSYRVEFVAVDSDRTVSILGNETIQQMDLVRVQPHNVMSVNTSQACRTAEQLLKDYPNVLEGTGKLGGQYTCKLEVEEGATQVVHPPRRVLVVLKGKLNKELDRLQSLGIIEKVTEPTPWVSSLVTIQKPNGQIRVH